MTQRIAVRLCYGAVVFLFVVAWVDTLWSGSADFALHYALTFRIADGLQLPQPGDPSLPEMAQYPAAAHVVAAMVGTLLGSPLLGMQVVALVSVALLWLAVVQWLGSIPGRAGVVAVLTFAGGFLLNRLWWQFPLHGGEVMGNFFFSHLVAQAFVLIGIAAAVRLESGERRREARVLLLLLIAVLPSIHLLGALELLGVLGILLATGWWCGELAGRANKLAALAHLAAGLLVILANPATRLMLGVSGNDGAIDMGSLGDIPFSPLALHAALSVLVLLLSAVLFKAWRREGYAPQYAAVRYAMAYGVAIGSLCLLQLAALQFGAGSSYAVKKYCFALVTSLFLSFAVLVGLFARRWDRPTGPLGKEAACAAGFLAIVLAVHHGKAMDTSDIVSLERRIVLLRDVFLDPAQDNVVVHLDLPATVQYMFSMGILKTPRKKASDLLKNELGSPDQFGRVIVGVGSPLRAALSCDPVLSGGSLLVLDARCITTGRDIPP